MILLLGGTSETAEAAAGLVAAGREVLVSTATDEPIALPASPQIRRRVGRLDNAAMLALIRSEDIRAVVDVTHPYAMEVSRVARAAARSAGIAYFQYVRPSGEDERPGTSVPGSQCVTVSDHDASARTAFSFGRPVLLTTGSNHLTPYVEASQRTGLALAVRVLPRADSIAACEAAGVPRERIIAEKGPFSVEANREHIRRFAIGVLVTKDSGAAGGVAEKREAAQLEGARVVMVGRPADPAGTPAPFVSVAALVAAALASLTPT